MNRFFFSVFRKENTGNVTRVLQSNPRYTAQASLAHGTHSSCILIYHPTRWKAWFEGTRRVAAKHSKPQQCSLSIPVWQTEYQKPIDLRHGSLTCTTTVLQAAKARCQCGILQCKDQGFHAVIIPSYTVYKHCMICRLSYQYFTFH